MKQDHLTTMLMDMYDIRRALPAEIKDQPKDGDGTDYTIGDLIDGVIEMLESYDTAEEEFGK
jgi:hypothetical protein